MYKKYKTGFTLIELMVSVALFSVVMTISLGALLSISNAERKAESLRTVMDNFNAALDSMSRTVRTGYSYHCDMTDILTSDSTVVPRNCPVAGTGANSFAFIAVDGTYTAYCLNAGSIWRLKAKLMSNFNTTTCDPANGFLPITATEISVTALTFYVQGAPSGDSLQPKLTMTLSGNISQSIDAPTVFNIQTSVTQRIYDQ